MTPGAREGAAVRAAARLLVACAWVLLLEPAAAARSDALRAQVVAPETQDELLVEALARVKGELSAAGFGVAVQLVPDDARADASIDRFKVRDAASAVIVVRRQPPGGAGNEALELWVYDPWDGDTAIIRSEIEESDPSLSAQRGAVQAVEVLRAVLARRGIRIEAGAGMPPPGEEDGKTVAPPGDGVEEPSSAPGPRNTVEKPGAAPAPQDRDARSGLVRVGAGLALWSGFDGLGSSLAPTASLFVALPGPLSGRDLALDLRASAAGLGWASEIALDQGRVEVRQALLTGDLVLRLRPRALLQPLLSLGAGAYAVSVEAEAEAPLVARSPHTWSGLLGGGAGLMLAVSTHFAALLQAQLLYATAPSDVSVDGRVRATAGAPMMLIGAQLMGGF